MCSRQYQLPQHLYLQLSLATRSSLARVYSLVHPSETLACCDITEAQCSDDGVFDILCFIVVPQRSICKWLSPGLGICSGIVQENRHAVLSTNVSGPSSVVLRVGGLDDSPGALHQEGPV
ncbi:hypothetical protein FIBSPDRAFT_571881 [Athelia psychrophila]|uniref:Uncharacterized protein n=1 Tax=Athelia psychrophila TaxID=1759441 RepID=A0A166HLD2_9AGAM|nr:hypothetical protein FIBSPDRAFT_571881 [Fibularhizoctonia sp. CBS 109695]